jgi:HEAT repeat protein
MKRLVVICLAVLVVGCGQGKKRAFSVRELIGKLKDKDPGIRYWAARQLGHHGAEAAEVVPALTEGLNDPDKVVRMGSAYALGDVGPGAKDAVPALQAALKDPEKDVRDGAAYALKKILQPGTAGTPQGSKGHKRPHHRHERSKPSG